MNTFNLTIIGLIFLSLVIIIVIFSRNIKRVGQADLAKAKFGEKPKKRAIGNFFRFIWGKIVQFFVFIAERIVKGIKKMMNLFHLQLIKIKNRKKGGDDQGAREALIQEEEKSLSEIIQEGDFDETEAQNGKNQVVFSRKKISAELEIEKDEISAIPRLEIEKRMAVQRELELEQKRKLEPELRPAPKSERRLELEREDVSRMVIERDQDRPETQVEFSRKRLVQIQEEDSKEAEASAFESRRIAPEERYQEEYQDQPQDQFEEEIPEEAHGQIISESEVETQKQPGFFGRIFSRFGKKDQAELEEDGDNFDQSFQMEEEAGDSRDFSDGLVSVKKRKTVEPDEENLIQEIVEPEKPREKYDIDEELGVDRKILEKALLKRIMSNPRDVKNYRELGDLYVKMGNLQDAIETYRHILKLTPRDLNAKRKLEKIRLMRR